jgi:hypothetical protein
MFTETKKIQYIPSACATPSSTLARHLFPCGQPRLLGKKYTQGYPRNLWHIDKVNLSGPKQLENGSNGKQMASPYSNVLDTHTSAPQDPKASLTNKWNPTSATKWRRITPATNTMDTAHLDNQKEQNNNSNTNNGNDTFGQHKR